MDCAWIVQLFDINSAANVYELAINWRGNGEEL